MKNKYSIHKFLIISIFILIKLSYAAEPKQAYEKMRDLSLELRCMVCQNQSLFDSDSELAEDLKLLIYEKFKNGESKKEIKQFLVERYGEFILFKPKLNISNILLWLAPIFSLFFLCLIGFKKLTFKENKK